MLTVLSPPPLITLFVVMIYAYVQTHQNVNIKYMQIFMLSMPQKSWKNIKKTSEKFQNVQQINPLVILSASTLFWTDCWNSPGRSTKTLPATRLERKGRRKRKKCNKNQPNKEKKNI